MASRLHRTLRQGWARKALRSCGEALTSLEAAMRYEPGPYPDPECPIDKWQQAHAHLTAARELLGMG